MKRRHIALALVCVIGLLAFFGTAYACNYFLDAPFLMKPVDAKRALESSRFLTGVEAQLLCCAVLYLSPVIVALTALVREQKNPLERALAWIGDEPRAVPLVASAVAVAAAAFVSYALIDHVAILDDERSYLFQANLFAHGKFGDPAVPHALRNQMLIVSPMHASRYAPGNAVFLALGVLAHAEYLVHPILAGVLVWLVHTFVKEAWGLKQAHLAAVMTALSPFVWCIHATLLSFAPAAIGVAFMLAALARHETSRSFPSALIAGIGGALLFITRPLEGVVFVATAGIWLIARTRSVRSVLAFAAGFAVLGWVLPLHNYEIMGSPFRMPYAADVENPFRVGFTRSFNGPYVHSPAGAAANIATLFIRMDSWLLGFPFGLVLSVIGLFRTKGPMVNLLRALIVAFVAMLFLMPAPGTWDVGPTYGFVLVPILIPSAVRGVHTMFSKDARAASWALVASAAVFMLSLTPLRLLRVTKIASEIRAPWDAIEASKCGNAVIAVPPIRFRMSAGWGYGYPYAIPTGPDTTARLFMPLTRKEYEEGLQYLGVTECLILQLDEAQFVANGTRRFTLGRLDPDVLWPEKR